MVLCAFLWAIFAGFYFVGGGWWCCGWILEFWVSGWVDSRLLYVAVFIVFGGLVLRVLVILLAGLVSCGIGIIYALCWGS